MTHNFLASFADPTKCGVIVGNRICLHNEIAHTDKAECAFCNYVGIVTTTKSNDLACPDCRAKDDATNVISPVQSVSVAMAREIDNKVSVRTDLFNAATVAIIDLKKSIDDDETVVNKPYALAQSLLERFNHFKDIIFEMNEKIVEAGNNQKAIQIYLNQLANTLRAEEREKLKIADINYKPTSPKPVVPKTIKTTGTSSKKLDKAEIRKWATEIGVPEHMLQMFVISKGLTPQDAAKQLKRSLDAAKSMTVTPNEVKQ